MACNNNNNDVVDDDLSLSGQPSTSNKSNQDQGGKPNASNISNSGHGKGKDNGNLKRRRHSKPKPNPSNIPISAECAYITAHEDEEDENEREYLLAAAQRRRSELVYRLQQQIRKQEIELAAKMKDAEAKRKNGAYDRKRNATCQCCKRRCT